MIIGISGKIGSGKDTVGSIIQYLTSRTMGVSTLSKTKPTSDDLTYQEWATGFTTFNMLDSNWQVKKFAGKLKQIVALLTGCTVEELESQEFKNQQLSDKWNYVNKWLAGCSSIPGNYPLNIDTYEHDEVFKGNPSRFIKHYTYRDLLQKIGTEAMRDKIHENIWINALMADYKYNLNTTIEEDKRLLSIWKNMNTRCTNPNYEKYHKYGGKGITICSEWKDFKAFKNWSIINGYTNELTLDRKNTNGNYEPSNCRYVTSSLQGFNKNSYDNKTSDIKGVSVSYNNPNKWQAQIQSKGIKENLGDHDTQEQAKMVYEKRYNEILEGLEAESKTKLRNNTPNWIITDMRFENELNAVEERGGICIRIERSRPYDGTTEFGSGHPSETALDNVPFKYRIDNNGTIEELVEKVREILIKENII